MKMAGAQVWTRLSTVKQVDKVEPQNDKPRYNQVLPGSIFYPALIIKYVENNLDITKSRYDEHVLPVP